MDMSLEGEMALGGENMRDVSGQRFVDIKSWAKEGLVILNRGDEDSTFKARFTDISLKVVAASCTALGLLASII